jgi:hypothetical protein
MREFPIYKEPVIEVIEDLEVLRTIEYDFAWDIETNSIKGHSKESKIISVAICDSEERVFVFLMPQKRSQRLPLVELLGNPNIGKYGHNIKFEHSWIECKLGITVQGWKLDTMLMCHCEDNRQGITSLKFQTLVNFGIFDYSSEIEPYLKAKEEKNANSINRIEELISTESGKQQLLKYNALDAYYTYLLAKRQELNLIPSKL